MANNRQNPSDFLKKITGRSVVVKLHNGSDYRGVLKCLDGYMNIVLEQTEEYINGEFKRKYGDAFIRAINKMPKIIVGIIGGTGLDQDSSLLKDKKIVDLDETPYGRASDRQAIAGQIEGVDVYIISRHGKNHDVSPSHVNYRANLYTLVRQLHCTHILVTSACGSLKEQLEPGHIGILNQYIDRTCSFRDRSFYKVCHVEQRNPINATMQKFILDACEEANVVCHDGLTCVTIEGPRFSTLAESKLHQSWGCDVVNMTSVPEVQLAAELGTMYACMLLITDYDCWRDDGDCVSSSGVVERMKELGVKAREVIPGVIKRIAAFDWSDQMKANEKSLKDSIMFE